MTGSPNIFPALRYRDANAALDWLCRAFGFEAKAVHRAEDGAIAHAELRLGAGLIMLGQVRDDDWRGGRAPDPELPSAHGIYVYVADVDAHHTRAAAAGAEVVRPLAAQDYGAREYSVLDPEGNAWSFGTYDPYAEA